MTQTAAAPRGRRFGSRVTARRLGSGSLANRMVLASAVLALIVAAVFGTLVLAVSELRDATAKETRAKDVTTATLALEKLVLDVETGLRGFVLTGQRRFLEPLSQAEEQLPERRARFTRLAAADPVQQRRAAVIVQAIDEYMFDYVQPLVLIVDAEPAAARGPVVQAEGKRHTDQLRRQFVVFIAAENRRAAETAASADERSDVALLLGFGGLIACAGLIVLFGLMLARSVATPVREAAAGASRLAGGDLSLRLDEGGPGEVGELTRSFNAMAEALETGHSELETQYERLRESEQLKSELVSIVSHEVRTPLASVLGFTSLLLNRDVDPQTRRDYLEIIDQQGRRLAALLDDFLNVQRIEEGRLELAAERVDLADLLTEQLALFRAESDRHRLELTLPPEPLPPVRGDANRLAQVVGNLLSNAIKYSPEGGVVHAAAEDEGGVVRIAVRDDGVGIPEEQQERIFTKFFRGDAAASGIAGSGLGLAFARAVVEAHGGRMSFVSKPGEGSTFWFELPADGIAA